MLLTTKVATNIRQLGNGEEGWLFPKNVLQRLPLPLPEVDPYSKWCSASNRRQLGNGVVAYDVECQTFHEGSMRPYNKSELYIEERRTAYFDQHGNLIFWERS